MFRKIPVKFSRKFTAIFPEISEKFPAEISVNFLTHKQVSTIGKYYLNTGKFKLPGILNTRLNTAKLFQQCTDTISDYFSSNDDITCANGRELI